MTMSKRFSLLLALGFAITGANAQFHNAPDCLHPEVECRPPKVKALPSKKDKEEALRREVDARNAWSKMTDAEKAEYVKANGLHPLPKRKPLVISPSPNDPLETAGR
jgi:hypothetical protein